MSEKKVWFITGASAGIGRAIAEEALSQGYRVVATARKPEVLNDLIEKYPGKAIAVKLDVTKVDDVENATEIAVSKFGRLDVVVNNAGYGLLGAIEEPSDEQIHQQFETNVFGVLNVVRGTLPTLRKQASGHIINVSSGLGFFAFPSYGYYSATKFAIQGISEALALEVAELGIKVTIAEPGGTRTGFISGIALPDNPLSSDYPTTNALFEQFKSVDGDQLSDPMRIAQILIEIAEIEDPPLHLPLGEDSFNAIEAQFEKVLTEIRVWREKASNTGYKAVSA